MNIDQYRERCTLPELEQKKLRRVAFCVDVEIAGSAQYGQDESKPHAPSLFLDGEEQRDHQLKASEGAALKQSASQGEDKPEEPDGQSSPEPQLANGNTEAKAETDPPKETTRKKEKKKRAEGERKERKDRKQRDAIANGKIPAEIRKEDSGSSSSVETPAGTESPSKAQDRPTTDPLRIYRRCCQLRETPILKRIVEQISTPSACPDDTPGTISYLDLGGYWMQLPDIVTLGDYLAVVPVKRLNMENCGLTDEAVRVILCGLLAAKTPEQAKYNRKLRKKSHAKVKGPTERLGVVEKLNLKNNPKIGKEGWRHIALFMHLSRSLKAIDLSMIPFPQESTSEIGSVESSPDGARAPMSLARTIQEAISNRLAGNHLEEVVMSSCNLSTDAVGQIVNAVMKCGATRLGLASNDIDLEGLQHILRYVRSGQCEGLDIGGNDIRNHLGDFASALDENSPLFALSLADCKLDPPTLEVILPALLRLTNFRFIDLSHNRNLFTSKPSCLNILRKYLPQFPILKRLHLLDVAMTTEHAIALAEILPEIKHIAHLNILENHLLSPLADAQTESAQEEACAFYASYMAAVRVSETLICIDIEVPSSESSEIVKALAKQVVAYSLRNLERLPLPETSDSTIAAMTEPHGGDKDIAVPDILLQLVGHMDGYPDHHETIAPAPDNDYIVGGTGVVKALDICLKRSSDSRKGSVADSPIGSGAHTPQQVLHGGEVAKGKAKQMSKNLLGSARKIRARLQPALANEARSGNEMDYSTFPVFQFTLSMTDNGAGRLKFLDTTLEGMIQRFEVEYPECRVATATSAEAGEDEEESRESMESTSTALKPAPSQTDLTELINTVSDESNTTTQQPPPTSTLSRSSSSRSLASRQAQEEGRMHRLGQRLKREILRPDTEDYAHGTTGKEVQAPHVQELRKTLEELDGPHIQDELRRVGIEGMLEKIGAGKEALEEMERKGEGSGDICRLRREMRERALAIYRDEMVGVKGEVGGEGEKEEGKE